uniref:Uncharacterized protein n=1 Tax=Heterorhabditis bacteriophora TaxID=37862 RepID=A0A1I7W8S5_HETBA
MDITISTTCIICRRINALPFGYPSMGPLPRERVIRANPFEHRVLIFWDPLNIMFTFCVEDLSAGAFLNCLQRFEFLPWISINSYMSNQRIKWIFNPPNSLQSRTKRQP